MLTEEENRFLLYWEACREKEGKWWRQLLAGIPMGLLFGVPVILVLFSGRFWFKRAEAAANSLLSPVVLIVSILLIAVFTALFYKRHQWEMKDQYYRELKSRKDSERGDSVKQL